MKSKPIPAILALAAAAFSCVASILQRVSFEVFTIRLLCSSVVFLILGSLIKLFADSLLKPMEEEISQPQEQNDGDIVLENIDSSKEE